MLEKGVPMAIHPAEPNLVNRRSIIQTGVILATALLFGVFLPLFVGQGANGCRLFPRGASPGPMIFAPGESGTAK
jgi:hypothetical protein